METNAIIKRLDRLDDLPTLPAIALEVNRLLEDYNTSVSKLSETIDKDQSIVSKILKLVNSAFFGLSSKVGNIPHAVTLLGFNTIRNAVVSVSVINSFPGDKVPEGLDIKEFWTHSVGVAVTSRSMAEKTRLFTPEDCFIAGLLHDVGKIVLAQYFPDIFKRIWARIRQGNISFYEAEREEMPVDHAMIGGYLTRKWQLPARLVDTITYHHSLNKEAIEPDLLMIVHAADIIFNSYMTVSKGWADHSSFHQDLSPALKGHIVEVKDWFPDLSVEIDSACDFFLKELG